MRGIYLPIGFGAKSGKGDLGEILRDGIEEAGLGEAVLGAGDGDGEAPHNASAGPVAV